VKNTGLVCSARFDLGNSHAAVRRADRVTTAICIQNTLLTTRAWCPSRRGLHSSCSDCLIQPPVHRSTVGSRAFSVAGPQVCNCLPPDVTMAPSLAAFRTRLKTFLFTESYP